MHQTIDIEVVELNEDTEVSHRRDNTFKLLADLPLHVLTFEPRDHIAGGLICAPFGHRAVLAKLQHLFHAVLDMELGIRSKLSGTVNHGAAFITVNRRADQSVYQ